MYTTGKIFGRICLKAIRDYFFQYVVCDQGLNFLVMVISNRRGKFKLLGLQGDLPTNFLHPDLPIRKSLRQVLGLLTVILLKRVSENIFFRSNKFTACKVKGEKEVVNSLMADYPDLSRQSRLSIHFKVRSIWEPSET